MYRKLDTGEFFRQRRENFFYDLQKSIFLTLRAVSKKSGSLHHENNQNIRCCSFKTKNSVIKKVFHYYLQFFSEIGSPISSRWDFHYKSQFSFFHHKSAETKVKGRFSHSIQFTFCGLNGTIGYIPRLADVSLFIEVLQLTSDKELLTHGALYTTPE